MSKSSRRTFLKRTAAASTAFAVIPHIRTTGAFGQSANDVVFATDLGVDSLDPTFAKRSAEKSVAALVMETLVKWGDPETMEIVPGLAESWELSDDGLVWTFALRQGVEFHDGTAFNADSVVYSFERLRDPAVGATELGRLTLLDYAEAIDEYTVALHTSEPYGDFLTNLTDTSASMFSREWAESRAPGDYGREPVGTGPFRYDDWLGPERVRFTPYDNYWGEAAKVDGIVLAQIPDPAALVAGIESHEIDVSMSVPPIEIQRLQANPELSVSHHTISNTNTIGMLQTKEPFSSLEVRKALNHLIDRDTICSVIYEGMATPTTTPLYPGNPFRQDQTPYEYNPDLARELLAEAGYSDGFSAALLYSPISPASEAVQAISQMMSEAGVQLELQGVEPAVWSELVRAKDDVRDLYFEGKAGIGTDWNLTRLYSRDFWDIDNRGRWENDEVERLLAEARVTSDDAVRGPMYEEIQKIIWEDAASVFLWSTQEPLVTNAAIDGIVVFPNPHVDLSLVTKS